MSHVLENETNLSHFLSGSVMFGSGCRDDLSLIQ